MCVCVCARVCCPYIGVVCVCVLPIFRGFHSDFVCSFENIIVGRFKNIAVGNLKNIDVGNE